MPPTPSGHICIFCGKDINTDEVVPVYHGKRTDVHPLGYRCDDCPQEDAEHD